MKLKTLTNQVIQNVNSNNFKIQVNAKAFSILAELYKNPIEAIVRELSTNAADSHVETGNYNPFDVTLPKLENPVFIIRDYGIGLSKYDFETVYFNMFVSTKDSNNNLNGCLGLGKAASLAYNSKTFTIESWKNGKYLCYLCFIGNSGMPEYTLLNEYDSDEEPGVKITINVRKEDCQAFITAATNVYQWFEVKPNTNVKLQYIGFKRYSDNFSISDLKRPIALMSGVAYPIEHTFNNIDKSFYNTGFVLYFEPGEIEFTPSRESIKYTEYTKRKIIEKINSVKKDIKEFITEETKDCKSQYQIAVKSINYKNLLKFISNDLEFKHYIPITKDIKDFSFGFYYRNSRSVYIGSCILVKNDIKTGGFSTARELSRTKNCQVLLINNPSDLPITTCDEDYILASSLYKKPDRKTSKNLSKVMLMKRGSYLNQCWQSVDINEVSDKFYIIRNKHKAIFNEVETTPGDVLNKLFAIDFNKKVYGFNKKDEKIAISNGFININEVFQEKIKEYEILLKESQEIYYKYNAIQPYQAQIQYIIRLINKFGIDKSCFHDIIDYNNFLKENQEIIDKTYKARIVISIPKKTIDLNLSHIKNSYDSLYYVRYNDYGQKLILLGYSQEKKNV